MHLKSLLPLLTLASLTLSATFTPAADAAVYHESFSGPTGGLPDNWVTAPYFNSGLGKAEIATDFQGNQALMQQRTANSGGARGNSWVYYNGSFSEEVENGVFTDFSASVVLQLGVGSGTGGAHAGLMLRTRTPSTTTTLRGYYVAPNNSGGVTTISIFKDPGTLSGGGDPGTLLKSSESSFTLSSTGDYLLSVSASGNQITGSLYEWDPLQESFSILLGTVTTTDDTYASGLFGMRSNHAAGPRTTYWRDLTITTIPEPGSAALLLPFGLAAWLMLRKTQRTA